MKKTIIIEILLFFNLAFYLDLDIRYFIGLAYGYNLDYLAYLCFTATLTVIIAIVLIAIKDFPCFKPLWDKLNAHKQARKIAKAEKAKADKQAKITELEKQLEELKKD